MLPAIQGLAHRVRTRRANRQLGGLLAFVAGAVNAGGFLAVQRYTSHVTGIISSVADDLVLGQFALAMAGVCALLAFLFGAATTAGLVHWARRRELHSEFALSLLVEALLLLIFGLLGANLELYVDVFVSSTVLLLCFIMGLQNAIVTKISKAEIRTTHMTGIVTDLGIELGRLLYWNRTRDAKLEHFVRADRDKLAIHATILGLFFVGGLVGATAFKAIGFSSTVPLSALLMAVAAPPLLRDLRARAMAAARKS
ncbi:YoaK family protein [Variovorax defluvii]|uniref:YoaK family protein n=1 Tax=Variovorax defluvii TaxID=913761 RepID=A0ABP8IAN4_9BURK